MTATEHFNPLPNKFISRIIEFNIDSLMARKLEYHRPTVPTMIRNYIVIALRHLTKNKGYSLINIGGLSIGLACCIAIGLYISDELSYDRFHSNYNNIYRVVEKQEQAGEWFDVAVTPGLLAPVLKTDFPEVKQTCRINYAWWAGTLTFEDHVYEPKRVLGVDNSFFSMFDFKLVAGNARTVLQNPDDIVITETVAAKMFGPDWRKSGSVVGAMIQLPRDRVGTIAGVAQDPPTNSHIQFEVLLSTRHEEITANAYRWNSNDTHTYILLNESTNLAAFDDKIFKYIDKYYPESEVKTTLTLESFSDIYLYSDFDFQTDWSKHSNILYIRTFLAVGAIVLMIALFNFVNLSTARAINRAREVGVRKVVGAVHRQLIAQFLTEAFLMTMISVFLALAVLQLFLPLLNEVAGKSVSAPFQSPVFLAIIFGFAVVVSLLAGTYPAFYLSGFKPAKVLKGVFVARSGQQFRRTLVVVQFAFSVLLIIGTVVIYRQLTFLQNKNLGFDKSQLLWVQMKGELRKKASLVKHDLAELTSVAGVSSTSTNLVNINTSTHDIKWEGRQGDDQFLITHINVDPDFIATTGIKLISGRNFDPAIKSDTTAWLINETAAKRMGWTPEQAIGKKITFWTEYEGLVIGVVKDFHFRPMTNAIEPCLFRYWPRQSNAGLFVKAKANNIADVVSSIEKICKKYDPKIIPYYQFTNDELNSQYRTEQNTASIVMYFSVLAILVSCLGLFGLAAYTAEQRTKEIGVRKVLGATVASIVNLLSLDFLKLVAIAIIVASPVAWWGMNEWLNDFAYKISVEWWMFVLSGGLVVALALLTISFQSIRAAVMNPVKSLRSE